MSMTSRCSVRRVTSPARLRAAGSPQASLVVRHAQPGQASTVGLIVVHSGGAWSTVVGGGAGPF